MKKLEEERFKKVINKAEDAFWEVIADGYQEIKEDVGYDVVLPLFSAMDSAVRLWVEANSEDSE